MEKSGRALPPTAVIVAGGDPIDPTVLDRLPHPAYVIAADSGLDHAERLGLSVDVVIGDFDSVSPNALERAQAGGALLEAHPVDKDATDLELALERALSDACTRAVLFGGLGGRLSHLLGNALVLTASKFASMNIEWHVKDATVFVVRPSSPATLEGRLGDLTSLLAAGGDVHGIATTGLRWTLEDATLSPGSTHGISNEMTDEVAHIAITDGVLLVVHERNQT